MMNAMITLKFLRRGTHRWNLIAVIIVDAYAISTGQRYLNQNCAKRGCRANTHAYLVLLNLNSLALMEALFSLRYR